MRNVLIFFTLLLTSGVPGCGSDELPAVPRTSDASVESALRPIPSSRPSRRVRVDGSPRRRPIPSARLIESIHPLVSFFAPE